MTKIFATGKRLLNERKRLKFTQAEIAKIGGVTEKTYINYEHGVSSPRKSFLEAVSKKGIDIAYIVMGKDEKVIITPLTKRLVEERCRLQLDEKTVAKSGSVSLSLYQRYEVSEADFDVKFLKAIAQLGIDIHYILTGEKNDDHD